MGFLSKLGDAATGGLFSLGGSLVSGIFGSSAQSSANKQNMKIAQMNNEYNERMLQKQMDYNSQMYDKQKQDNIDMWHMNNEYNSAQNQRKRLEEAGLNPYLMMNGGSAGVAQSMSAPSAQGINPPTATPYSHQANTALGTAVGLGTQQFLDFMMKREMHNANLEHVRTENKYLAAKALAEIADKHASAFQKRAGGNFTQLQHSLYGDIVKSDLADAKSRRESEAVTRAFIKEQTKTQVYNSLIRQKDFESYGIRFTNEISEGVARIALLRANKVYTDREAEHELEKMWTTAASRNGINLDNKKKFRTLEAEVIKAYRDAYSASGITDFISRGAFGNGTIVKRKLDNAW